MKTLNVALIGYKFMGKAHSSALLECPFFFKNGVQPVRKVIVGRHEAPLKQALDTGIRSSRMGEWMEVLAYVIWFVLMLERIEFRFLV